MKKALSILLAIIMIAATAPIAVFAENETSYKVGDHIQYGNYPQSKVTDSSTLALLDSMSKNWVSYRYYSGSGSGVDGQMAPADYMYYSDLDTNGDGLRDYRAVRIDKYRPLWTEVPAGVSLTYQDDNGYTQGNTYYFKYEPISWRILDPSDGLILTEKIMDSQAYNNYIISSGSYYYGDSSKTYYVSDYYNSSIRKWLNEDFYNTAFNSTQAKNIRNDVTLNNDCYSSSYPQYNSQASKDKMFLLSYNEATNSAYSFSSSASDYDTNRRAQGTDYAKAQGLFAFTYSSYNGYSWWWLRSPDCNSNGACGVSSGGDSDYSYIVNNTSGGVRVACRLKVLGDNTENTYSTTSDQCGENAYWSFDTETKALTITGSGEMYDFHNNQPWADFKEEIETVIIEPGLNIIGNYAFGDCTNLTSVIIPDSVTSIGHKAFYNCSNLTSIAIPDGVTSIGGHAFEGCISLTNVAIPNSVTNIDEGVFYRCSSLTSVTIPDSLTSIGHTAFYGCTNLTSVTIPNGVKSIGNYAFKGCISLTSMAIPDSVTSIGVCAFRDCICLSEIKVSENNTAYLDIDGVLFNKDKTELIAYPPANERTSYTIPAGVKRIADGAFEFCLNLKELTVCDDVEEIDTGAFYGCFNLEYLNLGKGIKKIGRSAFGVLLSLKNDIIFNEGLEEIEGNAFDLLKQDELTIPSTVTNIGYNIFGFGAVDVVVNKSKVASLLLKDSYFSEQSRNMLIDFYKTLLCKNGFENSEEKYDYYKAVFNEIYNNGSEEESEAFKTAVSYVNSKYGTSFENFEELGRYCDTNVTDKPYYSIACYEDSAQHEVCIENGYTHSIIDSTCDDACGKHNIYTNDIMEPTCTENGYEGGVVCLDCEKIFEAATIIPATGHTPKTIKGVAPTCTSIGLTDGVYCETCGKIITAQEEIPALSHTDTNNDGVCDTCGKDMGNTDNSRPLSFGERIKNFARGIVNAILELFKRLFG